MTKNKLTSPPPPKQKNASYQLALLRMELDIWIKRLDRELQEAA